MKQNKGFSLVELIVVIAIMAILVGVAVPVYTSYIDKAQEAKDAEYLANVSRAAQVFAADKGLELSAIWVAPEVKEQKGIELYLSDGSYYLGDLTELYGIIGSYDFETIETEQEIVYRDEVTPETTPEENAGTCTEHTLSIVKKPTCYEDGYEECTVSGCGYRKTLAHGHVPVEETIGNLHIIRCQKCDFVEVSFGGNLIGG